jgi:hypothetical protein
MIKGVSLSKPLVDRYTSLKKLKSLRERKSPILASEGTLTIGNLVDMDNCRV